MKSVIDTLKPPASRAVMPFGKYKGQLIATIPTDYLEWILDNVELKEKVVKKIYKVFDLRKAGKSAATARVDAPPQDFSIMAQAFGEFRRQLEEAPEGLF